MSNTEWEFEALDSCEYSDTTNDDTNMYGHFGIFSMPKSMEDYIEKLGRTSLKRKNSLRHTEPMVCTMVGS